MSIVSPYWWAIRYSTGNLFSDESVCSGNKPGGARKSRSHGRKHQLPHQQRKRPGSLYCLRSICRSRRIIVAMFPSVDYGGSTVHGLACLGHG
jgi:hypothetical protein